MVELMPIFQFDPQEHNYWGYIPLSFFALHHHYGIAHESSGLPNEFRAMAKVLHRADIEVILDVLTPMPWPIACVAPHKEIRKSM